MRIVSRLNCISENYEVEMLLDINSDIYPVQVNDRFFITLASRLTENPVEDVFEFSQGNEPCLADDYEYVMFGKVFRYQTAESRV